MQELETRLQSLTERPRRTPAIPSRVVTLKMPLAELARVDEDRGRDESRTAWMLDAFAQKLARSAKKQSAR